MGGAGGIEDRVSLSSAIDTLLNDRDRPVDAIITEFFSDDYRQRIGTRWVDRDGFRRAMEQVREMTGDRIIVTALDEIDTPDGARFAERHSLSFVLQGVEQLRETSVFGSRSPDGRFSEIVESTVVIKPEETPR